MQAFNTLIDNVACDDDYLQTTLRPAAEYDEFTVSHSACCSTQPNILGMHVYTCHLPTTGWSTYLHATHTQSDSLPLPVA